MSTIDISKGFRQYSPEELLEAGYKGTLVCGTYDLTDFIERLMQGVQEKIDNAYEAGAESANRDDFDDGYQSAVEEMRRKLDDMEG